MNLTELNTKVDSLLLAIDAVDSDDLKGLRHVLQLHLSNAHLQGMRDAYDKVSKHSPDAINTDALDKHCAAKLKHFAD